MIAQNWEEMKVNKLHIVISIFLLCALCGGTLYSCFSPPQNTPCMPIDYPEGKKIEAEQYKIYTFQTKDSSDVVYEFYKTTLEMNPLPDDDYQLATWREYSIRDIGVLFECVSRLNNYESELGCIFVNKTDERTVVYTMWSYNEGPGMPCYDLPEIEAEDYLDVYKP